MLMLGMGKEAPAWAVPVIGTSAVTGEGFDTLADAIAQHRGFGSDSAAGRDRRLAIAQFRLRKTAETMLLRRFADDFDGGDAALAAKLMRRDGDPYALAAEFLARTLATRKPLRSAS
jgi:LAO/AO transport system kinase